jgi:hypothetical protein
VAASPPTMARHVRRVAPPVRTTAPPVVSSGAS